MRERIMKMVSEFVRKEGGAAVPAAVRAATHGAKEALKIFPQEFARERRKRKKR